MWGRVVEGGSDNVQRNVKPSYGVLSFTFRVLLKANKSLQGELMSKKVFFSWVTFLSKQRTWTYFCSSLISKKCQRQLPWERKDIQVLKFPVVIWTLKLKNVSSQKYFCIDLPFPTFPIHIVHLNELSRWYENIFLSEILLQISRIWLGLPPFQLAASSGSLYRFHSLYFSAPIAARKKIVMGNCKGTSSNGIFALFPHLTNQVHLNLFHFPELST